MRFDRKLVMQPISTEIALSAMSLTAYHGYLVRDSTAGKSIEPDVHGVVLLHRW